MPRGRPRDFDAEEAMRQVTVAFWTRGYGVTSIADLEQGTGLGRTSLYVVFLNEDATAALRAMRAELEAAVLACLHANDGGRGEGDEAAIARFVVSTINGLAVSARMGASRAELQGTVDVALTATAAA